MPKYENNDLYLTDDGDLLVQDGLIQTTELYEYRSLKQELNLRLKFSRGEFPLTDWGAQLIDFSGLPNTPQTAARIKERIILELSKYNFIRLSDVNIDIYPTSVSSIIVKIRIQDGNKIIQNKFGFALSTDKEGISQ